MEDEFAIVNMTTEDIPAGGVVLITGIDTSTGFAQADYPTADNQFGLAMVSSFGVPVGGTGHASYRPRGRLTFDPDGDAPDAGDTLGSQSGSFLPLKGGFGFVSIGGTAGYYTNAIRQEVGTSSGGDVIGPDHAFTGALAFFVDPTGRIIGPTGSVRYDESRFSDFNVGYNWRASSLKLAPVATNVFDTAPALVWENFTGFEQTGFTLSVPAGYDGHATGFLDISLTGSQAGSASNTQIGFTGYLDDDGRIWMYQQNFYMSDGNGGTASGTIETYIAAPSGLNHVVMNYHVDCWMQHFASDGTQGLASATRTVKDGSGVNQTVTIKDGIITGWTT